MRRFLRFGLFLVFLLSACAPQVDHVAEPTNLPAPTSLPVPAHAEEIRFALIGEMGQVNVWELYDGSGSTYVNRALFGSLHPRLYQLSPLDSSLQPLAADGFPSEVIQDGDGYSATVKLRADLKWTDGSPFTAEDVAFTANTTLTFEFGYDWGAFYPRDYLARAEAVDSSTVKFIFKQKPNVGIWQYGVLQAPIVQKDFWDSEVQEAAKQLPTESLRAEIADFRANLEIAQVTLADLTAKVISLKVNGLQDRKIEGDHLRMQREVLYLQETLENLLEDYAAQINLAQESLHDLDDSEEPTLGAWLSGATQDDVWVNPANPAFPFGAPNFDRASYRFFDDEESALTAFQNGEVDFILSSLTNPPDGAMLNPNSSARFLVFNPANIFLADPALRSALSCVIDRDRLAIDILQNRATPLEAFVLSPQWHDANQKSPCAGMDQSARVTYAVAALKNAGYSWGQEPAAQTAGQNLNLPNGEAFPKVTLLAPSKEEDPLRYAAAKYVTEQAQSLGIQFAVREATLDEVVYAVYSSGKYDMAMMGWRLADYPAYLCEWFGGQTPLLYTGDRLKGVCETLEAETDLEAARQAVAQIESALLSELPFLSLFTIAQADVYRNLSYPNPVILNGWAGLYGAPSYAVPSQ
jgi:ABC-type transport system substrate-binding protein